MRIKKINKLRKIKKTIISKFENKIKKSVSFSNIWFKFILFVFFSFIFDFNRIDFFGMNYLTDGIHKATKSVHSRISLQ